jgi:hypothetical protein
MTEIHMAVRQLGDIILMAGGAEKLFQKGFARKRGEPTR